MKHEKKHNPHKGEFALALGIAILLIGSLLSERFFSLPFYYTTLLLAFFIILKIIHIIESGGTIFEDYASLIIIIIFAVLHFIMRNSINTLLVTGITIIVLYSAGLMIFVRKWFRSQSIAMFIISYAILVLIIIFLFAGVYYDHSTDFKIYGEKTNIKFEDAMYFSTVTFTTVGYGDITPTEINRLVASIEAFIGIIFNIAFIGFALTNRNRR